MITNQNVSLLSNDGGIPVIMIEGAEVPFPTLEYPLEGRMDFDTIQKRVPNSLMSHEKSSHVMSPAFLLSLNRDKFYLIHHLNEHGLQALTYFFYDEEDLGDWHKFTEEVSKNRFFKWNPGIILIYSPEK